MTFPCQKLLTQINDKRFLINTRSILVLPKTRSTNRQSHCWHWSRKRSSKTKCVAAKQLSGESQHCGRLVARKFAPPTQVLTGVHGWKSLGSAICVRDKNIKFMKNKFPTTKRAGGYGFPPRYVSLISFDKFQITTVTDGDRSVICCSSVEELETECFKLAFERVPFSIGIVARFSES